MAHKGFIRLTYKNGQGGEPLRRLQLTGIPRKHIVQAARFGQQKCWLRRGDHLTVCSLRELSDNTDTLLQRLAVLAEAGITVRSLDEPWYDPGKEGARQLLNGFAHLRRPEVRKIGRPRGLTPASIAKCQTCEKRLHTTHESKSAILASLHLSPITWNNYISTKQDYRNK